jgi:hypothetical protein
MASPPPVTIEWFAKHPTVDRSAWLDGFETRTEIVGIGEVTIAVEKDRPSALSTTHKQCNADAVRPPVLLNIEPTNWLASEERLASCRWFLVRARRARPSKTPPGAPPQADARVTIFRWAVLGTVPEWPWPWPWPWPTPWPWPCTCTGTIPWA